MPVADEWPVCPRSSAGRPQETRAPAPHVRLLRDSAPTNVCAPVAYRALKATLASRGTRERLESPERM